MTVGYKKKYDERIYSYTTLRQTVGWIGISLPIVLFLYSVFFSWSQLEYSISHYYYTDMRNLFVGALCAVALFMFFYAGYSWVDNWVGNIAGICSLGTAWLPTIPVRGSYDWYSTLHLPFAGGLFICFAFFSLFLFTKTKRGKIFKYDTCDHDYVYVGALEVPRMAKIRRRIYIVCGFGIIACILAMIIYIKVFETGDKDTTIISWIEFAALVFFGFSWLVKGEFKLLKGSDEGDPRFEDQRMLHKEAQRHGYHWVCPTRCGLLKDKGCN